MSTLSAARPTERIVPGGAGPLADALTIFVRHALPTLRDPFGLVFGMLQPLVFLVFFGPLLTGVIEMPWMNRAGSGDAWLWFVPAVLIMLALFGATGTGYLMLTEMQTGSHEQLMVTPMNRTAMLAGRVLNDVATLVAQSALIMLIMLPFGMRPHPAGVVAALVVMAALAFERRLGRTAVPTGWCVLFVYLVHTGTKGIHRKRREPPHPRRFSWWR